MDKSSVNANYAQLGKKPEVFKVHIEIDGAQSIPGLVPAINKESAIALLDIFRFAMKPKVRGYLLSYQNDELIVAVPAAGYIQGMTKETSLRGEPPEEKNPQTILPHWELTKMKPEKPMADAEMFNLDIIIDGAVQKVPVSGVNKESVISLLTQATCEKLPRIAGWNLWGEDGTLLASVPAVAFIGELAKITKLDEKPADPKTAGWNVVPTVAPTSQDFVKMIEIAKKEGRLPQ